jgi:hypothetical protein
VYVTSDDEGEVVVGAVVAGEVVVGGVVVEQLADGTVCGAAIQA